jgi:hypothetical protein
VARFRKTTLYRHDRRQGDIISRLWAVSHDPRRLVEVVPGFWMVKLHRRGLPTPAAIMWLHTVCEPDDPANLMERSPFLGGFISGDPARVEDVWHRRGEAITADEYEFQVAVVRHCREHEPDAPEANPRRAIDLRNVPSVF